MLCENEDLYCFLTWLGCLIWRKYQLCQAEFLLRFLSGDPIIFTVSKQVNVQCNSATAFTQSRCVEEIINGSRGLL